MRDKFGWLTDKIKGFAGDVLGSIKRFFESAHTVQRDPAVRRFISQVWPWVSQTERKIVLASVTG
jgi:hypothetical protein